MRISIAESIVFFTAFSALTNAIPVPDYKPPNYGLICNTSNPLNLTHPINCTNFTTLNDKLDETADDLTDLSDVIKREYLEFYSDNDKVVDEIVNQFVIQEADSTTNNNDAIVDGSITGFYLRNRYQYVIALGRFLTADTTFIDSVSFLSSSCLVDTAPFSCAVSILATGLTGVASLLSIGIATYDNYNDGLVSNTIQPSQSSLVEYSLLQSIKIFLLPNHLTNLINIQPFNDHNQLIEPALDTADDLLNAFNLDAAAPNNNNNNKNVDESLLIAQKISYLTFDLKINYQIKKASTFFKKAYGDFSIPMAFYFLNENGKIGASVIFDRRHYLIESLSILNVSLNYLVDTSVLGLRFDITAEFEKVKYFNLYKFVYYFLKDLILNRGPLIDTKHNYNGIVLKVLTLNENNDFFDPNLLSN
ncbi:uncharacterized protein ASCRUDRAFT_9719 [Ascoidea rubescens DSM 1968]|uniref:Uncharacterized protein n=1 Tax=Ascoidea rubescens DSM 1968 TaxID=1344418 RepID=A0A1D2VBH0_9ASCO|nr:hypothetical protein ASCRUDRAFT_9719 [Ascoidea rubescens DSM 1968]ODV58952.1 hypothetical protein ASCRUDRAFT_9719 [Ascoidea rubescens DSM 1968]